MKKYIVAAGLFLLMNSCLNNDFMEVYPKDQQTELTSFRSYENFKTYSWGLYNVFFGYAYKTGQTDEIFKGDYEADNMIKHVSGNESQWAYQKAKVPASSDSWDYEYIRRVNLMLDNIDQSSMNDAEKAHWRSVGYFFRAYKYFKVLRNKLTPLQIVITNGYTCSIFQVAKITKKGVWLCSLFCLIPIYLPSYF